MGDPYLSSDESLILSTHNILIHGMSLDLMLTSRRLILIDNSVTPFHLRTIPLETIISAVAGMDVKGDPIITMSYMEPSGSGAPHPMDFIFTRQKSEQRVKECNEWAASLGRNAAKARNEAFSAGTLPYDPVKVIQPRMSATYRIETFSPRKPVMEAHPARGEPITSPVLPTSLFEDGIPFRPDEPVPGEDTKSADSSDSDRSYPDEQGVREMPEPEEPKFFPTVISPYPDETLTIPETEEPVSFHPVMVPGPAELPVTGDVKPVESSNSPGSYPDEPEETAMLQTEEPVSFHPVIIPGSAELPVAEDVKPVESFNSPGSYPDEPEETAMLQTEEMVSLSSVMVPGSAESPAITDTAQIWAEAVRTATTSSPLIPTNPVPDLIPVTNTQNPEPKENDIHPVSIFTAPPADMNPNVTPVAVMIPEHRADDVPGDLSSPKGVPSAVQPPAIQPQKRSSSSFPIAAVVVIFLVVLGGAVMVLFYPLESGQTPTPVIVPTVTDQPAVTPIPTLVSADGVWVRIEYPGTFIGEVGNPDTMHPVSGSGVQFYKVLWSDNLVQASARKQDYSGDTLLIEVYRNGSLIKRSSTRTPMGGVDILIDPFTGHPPGIRYEDIP